MLIPVSYGFISRTFAKIAAIEAPIEIRLSAMLAICWRTGHDLSPAKKFIVITAVSVGIVFALIFGGIYFCGRLQLNHSLICWRM